MIFDLGYFAFPILILIIRGFGFIHKVNIFDFYAFFSAIGFYVLYALFLGLWSGFRLFARKEPFFFSSASALASSLSSPA